MEIKINNRIYQVFSTEYPEIKHKEYTNLKLYDKLGHHERVIGFLQMLSNAISSPSIYFFHTTHGGFIPIHYVLHNNKICCYLVDTAEEQKINIQMNQINHGVSMEYIQLSRMNSHLLQKSSNGIIYCLKTTPAIIKLYEIHETCVIFITDELVHIKNTYCFLLSETNTRIYIKSNFIAVFMEIFKYYIIKADSILCADYILTYDNLINLCIMVKNAGPQFETMLQENLHFIDKWTIFDTGSSDETLDIINRVLVGKKEGNLYQEPFINFRDSRNRLIDLAGNSCKYNIILDDTYIIRGDIRSFLQEVRSDQISTSFSIFIHSSDSIYGSNRILNTNYNLRYIHYIHEVIADRYYDNINKTYKENINIVIPENKAHIFDGRFDYMEKRTMERKKLDLELLTREITENPFNPRSYYYMGQTYSLLGDYENAFQYFMKRYEFSNSGFQQERIDAIFEAARIANFQLNKPWDFCENLYKKCFQLDESRPEAMYFIGIHYYLENNDKKAYTYFTKAFDIGFPQHCQFSLKPTLSYFFLPHFLAKICYFIMDYNSYMYGLKSAELFLLKNSPQSEHYTEMESWYKIYQQLTSYSRTEDDIVDVAEEPICCFVADGGYHPWSGSTIHTTGVGGSETYIIEMARYMKRYGFFGKVFVFCNTPEKKEEDFEGVIYRHLDEYSRFINTNYVHTCIISRYTEYLPITFRGYSENVYFVLHDISPIGCVILNHVKLKNIFCLSEWHRDVFCQEYPTLKEKAVPFYYGIDHSIFSFRHNAPKGIFDVAKSENAPKGIAASVRGNDNYNFIYSSFPNRGLYELLILWKDIYQMMPLATLHIYCDVNHSWSNQVEPEKMANIRTLLNEYISKQMGVYYYGWVTKKELAEAWKTANIWLYPCTFKETFCLTALEAAATKTLVITNGLAALENTAKRGIIIPGDATTTDWKQYVLGVLHDIINNRIDPTPYIEENYKWAKQLTWESQAKRLLEDYILPNVFEYKNMHNWTNDLPANTKDDFLNIIEYVRDKNKDKKVVKILEIGTYTGISLINIMKRIPNSLGYAIDNWENYKEQPKMIYIEEFKIEQSFYSNIRKAGLEERTIAVKGYSTKLLMEFIRKGEMFDFIYVDGSHKMLDCYADLLLSWALLHRGGIFAIDDYLFLSDDLLNSPLEAVNRFLDLYKDEYVLLKKQYRVFIEKR
jgi:predicted O-methyltransferase YrrM/tetratricopeptide (TPR) repeat protein